MKFGIVGTGFIAGVIANAISKANDASLVAVSSRDKTKAQAFIEQHSQKTGMKAEETPKACQGVEALLALEEVEVVYIATPTLVKESIAIQALEAGKHILVDKPFSSADSLERMQTRANQAGLVCADATHFSHHPRTFTTRQYINEQIGPATSVNAMFYFPFDDGSNIRFQPDQEPMGALGDLAWYSMRAITEYLEPAGTISTLTAQGEWHPKTNGLIRVSGMLGFDSGETSTFDVGYTAETAIMELSLVGRHGLITMDDFLLDWTNSFMFDNPDIKTGFILREGLATRKDFQFVETSSQTPQHVLMIEQFNAWCTGDDQDLLQQHQQRGLDTQKWLDTIWQHL